MFAQWLVNTSVATDSGSSLYATFGELTVQPRRKQVDIPFKARRVCRDSESKVILSNHSVWLWFCLDSGSACILPFPAMCPALIQRFRAIHQTQISLHNFLKCAVWLVPMWFMTATAVVLSILYLMWLLRWESKKASSPRKTASSSGQLM